MDFLVNLRLKEGKTIKEIASLLNISSSYYKDIELGKIDIKYSLAIKISNLFKMNPDDLFLDYYKNKD